ncbi:hypothetical protein QE152_g8445 [Popillia japonica]|uniref:Uncharacterized protein n=1 Tax=Popillia japonica TaxID=7064 RepID=A0AAW1MAU4_POPJA
MESRVVGQKSYFFTWTEDEANREDLSKPAETTHRVPENERPKTPQDILPNENSFTQKSQSPQPGPSRVRIPPVVHSTLAENSQAADPISKEEISENIHHKTSCRYQK